MLGYSFESGQVFTPGELYAWELATRFIDQVDDELPELRCHELARAAHKVLIAKLDVQLNVVDGKYGSVEHSWLTFDNEGLGLGDTPNVILDVYTPGALPMVQIRHIQFWGLPPIHRQYMPGKPRTDIRHTVVERLAAQYLEKG